MNSDFSLIDCLLRFLCGKVHRPSGLHIGLQIISSANTKVKERAPTNVDGRVLAGSLGTPTCFLVETPAIQHY